MVCGGAVDSVKRKRQDLEIMSHGERKRIESKLRPGLRAGGTGQRTVRATVECCLLCSLSARTAQFCFLVLTPILLMRQHFYVTRCNPDGTQFIYGCWKIHIYFPFEVF